MAFDLSGGFSLLANRKLGASARRRLALAIAATLVVGGSARAGTPLYWDGGTADIAANGDGASAGGAGTWNTTILNWDQGASAHIAWPNTAAFDAVFGGTAGTVTLGSNITAGNVSLGTTGYTIAAGTNTLTLNAGVTVPTAAVLATVTGDAATGGVLLSGGAGGAQTFSVAATSTFRITGRLSGADTLTGTGAGRIGLTGNNANFAGKIAMTGGTLGINSDASFGAVPGAVVADSITLNGTRVQDGAPSNNDGAFDTSQTFTINANRGIVLGANGATFQVGYGADKVLTIAGPISGVGAFTKDGDSGTVVLTNGNNSYAGTTNVGSNTLAVTANNALGTTAGGTTLTAANSILDLRNVAYTTAEPLNASSGGTIAVTTGTSSFAGNVTTGTGVDTTVSVTGTALTLSGSVNGNAGRYTTKTGPGTLTLSGTTDNGAGRVRVNAGTVILAKTSTGSVHAVGANGNTDYALILNGGTAQLGGTGGDQIYINSSVNMISGTFDLNGLNEGFDGLTGVGGTITNTSATASVLTLGQNNSQGSPVYAGTIQNGTGAVALNKVGTGTQTLSAANGYTGGTTITGGTLTVGVANAIPSAGTVSFVGGTLNANAQSDTMGPLAIVSGASAVQFGAAGDAGSVLTFASAALTGGTLSVTNWDGSLAGGGGDRFLFTANPAAALSAITFVNPAGLPAGTYTAQVVGTGPFEVVPVPEPTSAALAGLVGLGLLGRRSRSGKRRGA